jgi:hypothetical protein
MPRRLAPDDLDLDAQNPRLVGHELTTTQADLLRMLWSEGALDELALSIKENGFFDEEPLLLVKERGRFVVVEGNRRLAAVKLLRDDKLRQDLRATDLPVLSQRRRKELDELPTSIYPDRVSLWAYVGFRHVNGPMTWDSFAKAKYIADVHNRFGVSLDQIALSIGDKNQIVERLYRGLMVLEQATNQAGYTLEERSKKHFSFSHLYTGLDYAGIQQHLGLTRSSDFRHNPVPKAKLPNLRELMVWLFGSTEDGAAPVVRSQNPDLKRLDDVLKDPRGIAALRGGLGLQVSHQLSLGDEVRFREALTRAKYELQQTKGLVVNGYGGERDLLEMARAISELTDSLLEDMEKKAKAIHRTHRA